MEYNFTDVLADLVFEADLDLNSRLEYQEQALREVECVYPLLGRWVDATDVNYLLSVFALKDEDFADMLPTMAHIAWQERQSFLAALETHFEQCQHCALKRGYDLEMDARIERACQQNSDGLLQMLREDTADSVEDVSAKPRQARAAKQ